MEWLPLVLGALILLGSLVAAAAGVMKLRHRRTMRETATSGTGAAPPGPVEVHGRAARPPKRPPARGPFTQAEGVFVSWRIEERSGGKSDRWIVMEEGHEGGLFAVDDGSGPLLVDVEQADLQLEATFTETSRVGRDPSPAVLAYLKGQSLKHEGWLGINKRMRFTETVVKEGDPLYVLGVAEGAPAGSGARAVVRTGTRAVPFIVSTRSEREVRARTLKGALASFAGALVAAAFGALFVYFGVTG